ncbi:hypothetical protein FGB62_37g138 [Gracilaria domingensis]|nr:hypothetical protein FGB62_37g138 [Gracilaria domingensis]
MVMGGGGGGVYRRRPAEADFENRCLTDCAAGHASVRWPLRPGAAVPRFRAAAAAAAAAAADKRLHMGQLFGRFVRQVPAAASVTLFLRAVIVVWTNGCGAHEGRRHLAAPSWRHLVALLWLRQRYAGLWRMQRFGESRYSQCGAKKLGIYRLQRRSNGNARAKVSI